MSPLISDPSTPNTLTSVQITGPQDFTPTGSGSTIAGSKTGPWPAGNYTLTATDGNGLTTTAPFNIASLSASLDPSSQETCYFGDANESGFGTITGASYTGILDLTSSQGLFSATPINSDGSLGSPIDLTGQTTLTSSAQSASWIVEDYDGNEIYAAVNNTPCSTYGPPDGSVTLSSYIEWGALQWNELDAGDDQDIDLGLNAAADDVNVAQPGALGLTITTPPPTPPGMQPASAGGIAYDLGFFQGGQGYFGTSASGFISGAFNFVAPIIDAFNSNQLNFVQAWPIDNPTNNFLDWVAVPISGDPTASYSITPPSSGATGQHAQFAFFVPVASSPVIVSTASAQLLYDGSTDSGITLSTADPTQSPLSALISVAAEAGLNLAGPVFQVTGSSGTILNSPAALTLPAFAAGYIYALSPSSAPVLLSGQFNRFLNKSVAVPLTSLAPYYAVFSASVTVAQGLGSGGRALASDSTGKLYEVVASSTSDTSPPWLSIFNSSGVFQSSTTLTNGIGSLDWIVRITSSEVFVIGTAGAATMTGTTVAVYKLSHSGVLQHTTYFDVGSGNGDIALGAAQTNSTSTGTWIAGAQSASGGNFRMGLWLYSSNSNSLTLTSTFSGTGYNDGGFGVNVDTGGNVWVVGFSSDSAATTSNPLDLALWKFNSSGTTLLDGPYVWPGFGQQITNTNLKAEVVIDAGLLYVSASRLNPLGNYDLDTLLYEPSGEILSEQIWHGAAGSNDLPQVISTNTAEGLAVDGESDVRGTPAFASWTYDSIGQMTSAQTINGEGPARGSAVSLGQTWYAVTTSSFPITSSGAVALYGSNGLEGPAGSLIIATQLSVSGSSLAARGNLYISTAATLSFAANEYSTTRSSVPGIALTNYLVDVSPDACATPFVSTASEGTCANPVYDDPFSLSNGTHTVSFLSIDQAGNEEQGNAVFIGVGADTEPPRTSLLFTTPAYSTGSPTYVTDVTTLSLVALDDFQSVGDDDGPGASATYLSIDSAAYSVYSGTFSLVDEGAHNVSFYSVDYSSNYEVTRSSAVDVDLTPPITTLQVLGSSDTSGSGGLIFSSATYVALSPVDPISNGVASGVAATYYVIDEDPFSSDCESVALSSTAAGGTCANELYESSFTLSVGTHTVYYFSEDNVGNQENLEISSVTVSSAAVATIYAITPSSGPIGTAFLITGSGFGAFSSSQSVVTFAGVSAPIAVWLSTAVSGNVPGTISTGTAAVVVQSVSGGSVVESSGPAFLVDVPTISTITPNTGPTGTGVMIGGFGFGSYNGSDTELLVAGSSVSLSVWIDTEIVWTVPSSLSASTVTVQVSLTPPGGSVTSNTTSFVVTSGGEGGHALGMFGGLAAAPVSLAAMPDWYFLGDMLLSSVTGGVLQTPSGAALQVPPYAVAKNTQFTMTRVDEVAETAIASAISQQKLAAAGQAVSFGPPGPLARAVTLVLPYDPSLVTASSLGSLEIYYFDPDTSQWSALPTKVLGSSHLLTAQTSHFSLYQPLMLAPLVSGGGAFDVFGLRTSYAFPNPSHHGAAVDFRLETGLADSVELHVYNLAGRRVLSTSLGAVNFITDPTLGSQDAYDYVWDVSGVGTGVYEFVFVAHKSGEHDVIATGKVGVIK